MNDDGEYNVNPRKMYYSAMATGKRVPLIWEQSPRLDPDEDGIIQATDSGMIYQLEGADGKKNFAPLLQNTISVMKMVIIIMAIISQQTHIILLYRFFRFLFFSMFVFFRFLSLNHQNTIVTINNEV